MKFIFKLKPFFLLLLLLTQIDSLSAQDNDSKISVAIMPFTYASVNDSRYVFSIRETVENAFMRTRRFNIVERARRKDIQAEKDLQKHEDFLDSKVMVAQGKSLGARYIVTGHVVAIGYKESYSTTNGTSRLEGYTGKINLLLKVIDIESGQIIASETIDENNINSSAGFWGNLANNLTKANVSSTPETAMVDVIKGLDKCLTNFIAKSFPVVFHIIEIQDKKSDGSAKTLLLAGGSGYGLNKGDRLRVVERKEVTIDGRTVTRNIEVGELKVSKVEDANFSICNVVSGGDAITQKFAGNTLVVITK
jgi:curli biogenesis system outer membrane secretion channel CsgG